MAWWSGLEEICQVDVPLREHTWYGLGGAARWLLLPRDEEELSAVVTRCAEHGVSWRVLGRGANVLVRDQGFDGAVIKLSGTHWERTELEGTVVHAAAGVDFPKLVRQTAEQGLAGLEKLAGIPGTVGGVIRMNAGGRYGNVAPLVRQVRLMMPDGTAVERPAEALGFRYRGSELGGAIVMRATFGLEREERETVLARFRQIWSEKAAEQPSVSAKTAGCIFKNPPGQAAGALIDQAGLKGCRRGGAEISPRHANFIVAYPGATAENVLDLITLARERVHRDTGIELELEVEIW